jgi:murein endopeptidase
LATVATALLRRSRNHFRVRLACSTSECKTPPAHGEGCAHNLDFWFKESVLHSKAAGRATVAEAIH